MTNEQLEALKTEIDTHPETYGGKTNSGILDILKAKNIPARKKVPWFELFNYCMVQGFWPGIVIESITGSKAKQAVAIAAVELREIYRDQVIDTGLPIFAALTQELVDVALITAGQRAAMIAMGDTKINRLEELERETGISFGTLYEGNIGEAVNYG